jgi:hypothetical protein
VPKQASFSGPDKKYLHKPTFLIQNRRNPKLCYTEKCQDDTMFDGKQGKLAYRII